MRLSCLTEIPKPTIPILFGAGVVRRWLRDLFKGLIQQGNTGSGVLARV